MEQHVAVSSLSGIGFFMVNCISMMADKKDRTRHDIVYYLLCDFFVVVFDLNLLIMERNEFITSANFNVLYAKLWNTIQILGIISNFIGWMYLFRLRNPKGRLFFYAPFYMIFCFACFLLVELVLSEDIQWNALQVFNQLLLISISFTSSKIIMGIELKFFAETSVEQMFHRALWVSST